MCTDSACRPRSANATSIRAHRSSCIGALRLLGTAAMVVVCVGCESQRKAPLGETFDAGHVFADSVRKVSHQFTIRNTADRTLKISGVTKTCGCTSFDLEKSVLGPGESTKLDIHVATPRSYQQVFASCTLHTDHPVLKSWQYTLKFTSLPGLALSADHVNFGRITKDGPDLVQPAYVDIFGTSVVPLSADSFSVPDGMSVESSDRGQGHQLRAGIWNTRYPFRVKLRREHARSQYGHHAETIGVRAPNGARSSLSVIWSMTRQSSRRLRSSVLAGWRLVREATRRHCLCTPWTGRSSASFPPAASRGRRRSRLNSNRGGPTNTRSSSR
jgi:hypothetical protein